MKLLQFFTLTLIWNICEKIIHADKMKVVCNCSMFCCTLLYIHYSFAIILMGKRKLAVLLILSSWCLVVAVWLFLTVPWVYLQFVIVVFPDHTHLLFFIICLYVISQQYDLWLMNSIKTVEIHTHFWLSASQECNIYIILCKAAYVLEHTVVTASNFKNCRMFYCVINGCSSIFVHRLLWSQNSL